METTERQAGWCAGSILCKPEASIQTQPTSAYEAVSTLDRLTRQFLQAGDGRAAFSDLYAIITRRVATEVAREGHGMFLEPRWISRLSGRFCERYLQTLRWSFDGTPQDTGAWAIAYALAADRDGLPLQRAVLGLSAHINYDLALGIAETIRAWGAANDPVRIARFKHDHDTVNILLRAAIPEAIQHLMAHHRCPMSLRLFRHATRSLEWVAMSFLTTWRTRVWNDAMGLLRDSPEARRRRLTRLERRSRWLAHVMALPSVIACTRQRSAAS